MAENTAAATETTSLPSFMRAGMDFFTGKTVLASTLAEETKKLEAAYARIATLEKSNSDSVAIAAQVDALTADVAARDAQIASHKAKIETLSAEAQTAARQAQIQVARAGAAPAVVTGANKDDAKNQKAVTFPDLVAKRMAEKNVTKATAIGQCISEFKAEYAEWLKGDTSKI